MILLTTQEVTQLNSMQPTAVAMPNKPQQQCSKKTTLGLAFAKYYILPKS